MDASHHHRKKICSRPTSPLWIFLMLKMYIYWENPEMGSTYALSHNSPCCAKCWLDKHVWGALTWAKNVREHGKENVEKGTRDCGTNISVAGLITETVCSSPHSCPPCPQKMYRLHPLGTNQRFKPSLLLRPLYLAPFFSFPLLLCPRPGPPRQCWSELWWWSGLDVHTVVS